MTIQKAMNAAELTVTLSDHVAITAVPQLERKLKASTEGVETLALDFAPLDCPSNRLT